MLLTQQQARQIDDTLTANGGAQVKLTGDEGDLIAVFLTEEGGIAEGPIVLCPDGTTREVADEDFIP